MAPHTCFVQNMAQARKAKDLDRPDLIFVIFLSTEIFSKQIFLHANVEQKRHKF